jgi:hypothetical protein
MAGRGAFRAARDPRIDLPRACARSGRNHGGHHGIGNDPNIHASLFSPGYTIAAVIANEFTEATGDVYLSALVELGLVLFLLTIVINGMARILIVLTTKKGTARA